MEKCAFTYDHYITQRPMDEALWSASLFQIIMILLTYQKVYGFTHNDLHTNNIMYVETEHEYLDYVYDGKRYPGTDVREDIQDNRLWARDIQDEQYGIL